jgi:hypothetical protein
MAPEKRDSRRKPALALLGVLVVALAWLYPFHGDSWVFQPFALDDGGRGKVMAEQVHGADSVSSRKRAGTARGKGSARTPAPREESSTHGRGDSSFTSHSSPAETSPDHTSGPGFAISMSPATRVVGQGDTARFEISITRSGGFSRSVALSASGLPNRAAGAFGASQLVVATQRNVTPGSYRIVVTATARGAGSRLTRSVSSTLIIRTQADFSISGTLATKLSPGTGAPVNLTITNPHPFPIRVTALATRVDPRTSSPACSGAANFAAADLRSPRVQYGFVIPRRTSRTLSQLKVPAGQRPWVHMLNLATNQDACKDVRIFLQHSGRAVRH